MLPEEGYITTDDGVRLFFQKSGTGPQTVVILNAVHMFESFKHLAEHRTVIFFDLRNRGRSDSISDNSKLAGGVHHDADDLDAIRRHFGVEQVDVIGHSYLGLVAILYALKYPAHVRRVVQIGPAQPDAGRQYPAALTGADETLTAFGSKMMAMHSEGPPKDPAAACAKFWALVRELMVVNPADADKIRWTICDCPNELSFMGHWMTNILPSIQRLRFTGQDLSKVSAPVLTIHGTRDRQASYGGGRDWASILPDARLLTIENAAHVPWIEAPEKVFGAIDTFLDGAWPDAAKKVAPSTSA